jgi:cobalt-zinc-cadmium efflux system outer membrane protein
MRGTRVALVANVKHAFFEVLHRKEEINHTRQSLELVQDLRRRVAVQVDVGEVGRLELTRAEAEIAIAQTAMKGAQLRYAGAVAALRVAIGAPATDEINPVGSLDVNVAVPALDAARKTVLQNHPAIAQARAEMERAQSLLANEKALRFPQFGVYGEYEHQPDLTFYRAGLNIPLPLWNRRKGEIEAATAEVRRAAAVEAQRRLELTAALERSYSQFQLADDQVKSFQAGSLRQAEAALTAAQAAYRFGERGIIEVLDAQRVLQSVRGDYLDARFQREDALIDLEELGAVSGIGDGK